jgi:hypothetical protein
MAVKRRVSAPPMLPAPMIAIFMSCSAVELSDPAQIGAGLAVKKPCAIATAVAASGWRTSTHYIYVIF